LAELVLVGPVPPPSGGIASHVAALARVTGARAVDPRDRAGLAVALTRAAGAHVHVCGHNRPSYALIAACAAAAPTVATIHSGLLPAWLAGRGRVERRLIAKVLRACREVVAVSEPIAAALRALDIPAVVATPFLPEALRPGAPPAAFTAARAAAPCLVTAAVASGHEYGVDVLRDGLAMVRGATLAVFGPLAVPGAISLGELDHAAALGVMAQSDVFVRPTRADGDAVSVREALALGVRVVASDASPRPASVTLFRAGEAPSLACAIEKALAAPPPPPSVESGFPAIAEVYRRAFGGSACAVSPAV
jgi:glycosyltransferase involved in cell wall biosynthesis